MRINLVIDPYVFACPPCDVVAEFESFVESILLLKEIRDRGCVELYTLEGTVEILAETGRYPMWEDLSRIFDGLQLEEIQQRDVVALVESVLNKSRAIEPAVGVVDLLYECISKTGVTCKRLDKQFEDAFERNLVLMAMFPKIIRCDERDVVLATCGVEGKSAKVGVTAKILLVDWASGAQKYALSDVSGSFVFCSDRKGYERLVDAEYLWLHGECEGWLERALNMAVADLAETTSMDIPAGRSLSVGAEFLKTVEFLRFRSDVGRVRRLLRACVETVLKLKQTDTHWLRAGRGGGDPQRLRGADKAWRRDIDDEFHLHYWETPTGVEFARVVVHNDFSI
jgi:hypothetical protein